MLKKRGGPASPHWDTHWENHPKVSVMINEEIKTWWVSDLSESSKANSTFKMHAFFSPTLSLLNIKRAYDGCLEYTLWVLNVVRWIPTAYQTHRANKCWAYARGSTPAAANPKPIQTNITWKSVNCSSDFMSLGWTWSQVAWQKARQQIMLHTHIETCRLCVYVYTYV